MDITEILTNPLVWGFIVWLFSRLFTFKNKDEKPNKQTSKKESRSRPIPAPRTTSKHVSKKVEDKARKEVETSIQTVQQSYENMKARADKHVDELTTVKLQTKKLNEFPNVNRNVSGNHLLVNRQKAVQGVVWSEILGAPRSKNPHYTRNRRHS